MDKIIAFLVKIGFVTRESIHYIGGSDVLPPPLRAEAEQQALTELEAGGEEAKQLLISHNLRLVVFIARRFENTGI
jgi:RNA polymerase sporulation-specific sigma factor